MQKNVELTKEETKVDDTVSVDWNDLESINSSDESEKKTSKSPKHSEQREKVKSIPFL